MDQREAKLIELLQLPTVERMPRASWSIGTRVDTVYLTIHYNGPRVNAAGYPPAELDQLRNDARWHMRPGALGARSGGDGIQYHGATLSNGANYRLRGFSDKLWHCANATGNALSLAWHIPIGEGQFMPPAQTQGLTRAIEAIRYVYGVKAVNVKGHLEWSSTACPGSIMPYIRAYRDAHLFGKPVVWYRTKYNVNCRQAPDVSSPIALSGRAVYAAGTIFAVDEIKENGVIYAGSSTYVHRADQVGFFHISVVEPVGNVQWLI